MFQTSVVGLLGFVIANLIFMPASTTIRISIYKLSVKYACVFTCEYSGHKHLQITVQTKVSRHTNICSNTYTYLVTQIT